jgi:RecA-family ATPase
VRNGAWLSERVFDPLAYAVPDILPAGFTVLAGPPKAGKSYLVLDWLLAVAAGGRAIGQIAVGPPRQVFYLALEDSDRRMQHRCMQILDHGAIPEYFAYETHLDPGAAVPLIEAFMSQYPATALIVIDTLGRVMPPMKTGETTYQRDYRVGARLQAITMAYPGLCIVANHHTRKGASPDFVENVSGTNGLPGAADTIIVLSRDRNTAEGTLNITGRDVEEAEYALTSDHGRWVIDGSDLAEAATVAQERGDLDNLGTLSKNILAFVAEHSEGVAAKEVADKFGKAAYTYLKRLDDSGHLDKPSRGYYCTPQGGTPS